MQQLSPSEETANLLSRLSQRPGVQGTLILSRDSGAIVRSSGLATEEDVEGGEAVVPGNNSMTNGEPTESEKKGTRKAEDIARLVWNFVQGAGTMIEELNGGSDEMKLLRIRSKRNELVIVPGRSFYDPLQGHIEADAIRRFQISPSCDA